MVRKARYRTADGKARWEVDYRDAANKRRWRVFPTKKEADAFFAATTVELLRGTHVPDGTSCTVDVAAKALFAAMEADGAAPVTVIGYRGIMANHISPYLGATACNKLSAPGVKRWLDKLDEKGVSKDMAGRARKLLQAVIDEAIRDGAASHNPVREYRPRRAPRRAETSKPRPAIPSPEQVRTLLDAADPPMRQMLMLAAVCGMRWGEIRALRWRDVGVDRVSVRQAADRLNTISPPKTAASIRDVPLPPAVARELEPLRGAPDELLFPTSLGTPVSIPNLHQRLLAPLFKKAGVPWFKPHAFRHFAVSLWRAGGIDWPVISRWVGHTNVSFTIDTYAHLFPDDVAEAARRMQHANVAGPLLVAAE